MNDTTSELLENRIAFRLISTLLTLLIFTLILDAQSGVQWSTNYGGSSNDIPKTVQKTPDQGFIIAGQSASADSMVTSNYGGYDAWVVKINANGGLLWEKNFGGTSDEYILDIQVTTDDGYILIGGAFSEDNDLPGNNGNSDIWVLKLNQTGVKQWSKNFGGHGVDFGTSIQETIDGGFILTACTNSAGSENFPPGAGGNDILVMKLNASGDLQWQKIYGGSRHDGPKKILQTADGGYLVGGNTWSTNGDIIQSKGQSDVLFLKLDETGEIEWSKNFGGVTTDRMNDFIESSDGNFVMTGTYSEVDLTGSGFGGRYDENFWILKFNASGEQLWEKNYGGSKYDESNSIILTDDGGYLLGGVANSSDGDVADNVGLKDIWILKTDDQGDLQWSQSFGGEYNEEILSVLHVNTDEYLLVGYSSSVYVDTLFESNGLEDWFVMKLGDPDATFVVNLGADLTVCANEEFYFDVSVPNCNCQYVWNDGSNDSQRTLSTYITTTYSVTVTDDNGFSLSDQIVVNVSVPEVAINKTEADCYGQANGIIDLVPGGNYSYEWNDGVETEDRQSLTAGTYTVTITNDLGCFQQQIIEILEPPSIELNETVMQISCYGGADGMINLNPSGGIGTFDYSWTGTINSNDQDVFGLSVGTYSVVVTDDNNCTTASSWNISQPDQISIGLIPSLTSCFNSEDGQVQINVNGGTGSYDYLWSNGFVTPELTAVAPETYTVTVTDENMCTASESITVNSPVEIEVDAIIALASCFGNDDGSIITTVSGGVGDYQFHWNTNDTSPNLENLMAGTYTVTVTDDNMCEQIAEFVVSQNSTINVNSTISDVSCYEGTDGAIEILPTGGIGGFSFVWNTGDTTQNINQISAGDYTVTVMDENNCQDIQLFTVKTPEEIMIFPIVTAVSCYGESDGSYQVDVTGGTGGYTLAWSAGGNTELSADTYTITVTDENACEQTLEIVVPQPDSLYATLQVVHPVSGNDGIITATGVGGIAPFDFAWKNGDDEYSGDQLTNLSSGFYTLTLTDANDCVFEVTILLGTVSTKEIESLQTFEIYPNPNDGQFYIQLEFNHWEKTEIEITNELGQVIQKFSMDGNSILKNIDLPNIPAGMYFISIKTAEGIAVKRMVVLTR